MQFCTGASRVPAGGFKNLSPRFTFQLDDNSEHLPSAQTCFNKLKLPRVDSQEELHKRLMTSLTMGHGFGLA